MLDDAEARHDVEALLLERERNDVGLRDPMHRPDGEVFNVRVHRRAEVDRRHPRPLVEQHFGETPGAAAAFEDIERVQIVPERFPEAAPESVARDWHTGIGVELGETVTLPLFPEMIGVGGGRDEARNLRYNGEPVASRTDDVVVRFSERIAVLWTGKCRPRPQRRGLPLGLPDAVLCRNATQSCHCPPEVPPFTG